MPKLPVISAKELARVLQKLNFAVIHQKGSHIKLKKKTTTGEQTIIIPNHKVIRKGTLKNILRLLDMRVEDLINLL